MMPANEVTVAQLCGKCNARISTFNVKQDNLMLTCSDEIWCPVCGENTPEVRDVAGRLESVKQEVASYPQLKPADSARRTPSES